MPEPPRRARFQIHLSTAIVLMFVAGGLIWANVYERGVDVLGEAWTVNLGIPSRRPAKESEFFATKTFKYWSGKKLHEHGWPFDAMQNGSEILIESDGKMVSITTRHNDELIKYPNLLPAEWRTGPIIYDALIALLILFAVWFLCEWLIRRRAARKGA